MFKLTYNLHSFHMQRVRHNWATKHTAYASKVMIKILQARLQQYVNWEVPDVQLDFKKGRGTRDQIANICWITEKTREFQKNKQTSISALLTMLKLWTVWITTKCKVLQEMGIPDHLTYPLRNLYAGQEAAVRIRHGTTDGFQTGEGVHQGCMLSCCLFNLYAEHIMQTGWITSWNQDCWQKYQQPQIRRWYCSNGRKWSGTKEHFEESVKSWLKTQHSKN